VSDNESLHDFIVDDENDGYLKEKPSGASADKKAAARGVTFSSAKAMQPVKTLHPRFQSGSTSADGQRRYLGKQKRDNSIPSFRDIKDLANHILPHIKKLSTCWDSLPPSSMTTTAQLSLNSTTR
jgi:hypothetical protein